MSKSVSESAPPCQIKQFQFYTYMYLLKHQTRHIHKPSPHFFPRLQDRQPKDPSQYPIPPADLLFLKFSVFSFLLTRRASLSHSARERGGGRIQFFVHAIFTAFMLITRSVVSYFLFYTSVRPPRSYAKLKTQTKFGYSRSRVCSGIILLDGCVHG